MTGDDRLTRQDAVPTIDRDGRQCGVRLATVPQPWKDGLRELMRREAVSVFNEEGLGD